MDYKDPERMKIREIRAKHYRKDQKEEVKKEDKPDVEKELKKLTSKADVVIYAKNTYGIDLSDDMTRKELDAAVIQADKADK